MSAYKISINIVAYNGMKYLPHCLASIKSQTCTDYEVIIVDNNSQDECLSYIRENYPEFKIVEKKENIGFAKGHNVAIEQNKSEYILCLNQDIILEPDFLENIVDFLDKNLSAGAVTGKLCYWDFENNKKTNQIDSLGLQIHKTFKVSDIAQGKSDAIEFDQNIEIFGVSGAAPIYRRSALESIKTNSGDSVEYFDEDFFMYKEDVDLAFRLRGAGWQSFMVATAKAFHDRSIKSAEKLIKNRRERSFLGNYYSYRNHLFVLLKNLNLTTFLLYSPYIISYEMAKFGYILLFEHKTLPSALDFFKNFAKIWNKRKAICGNRNNLKQMRRWIE